MRRLTASVTSRHGIWAILRPVVSGVDPRVSIVSIGSRDKGEVVVGEMSKALIREVRESWQFYRDRRPETYQELAKL